MPLRLFCCILLSFVTFVEGLIIIIKGLNYRTNVYYVGSFVSQKMLECPTEHGFKNFRQAKHM